MFSFTAFSSVGVDGRLYHKVSLHFKVKISLLSILVDPFVFPFVCDVYCMCRSSSWRMARWGSACGRTIEKISRTVPLRLDGKRVLQRQCIHIFALFIFYFFAEFWSMCCTSLFSGCGNGDAARRSGLCGADVWKEALHNYGIQYIHRPHCVPIHWVTNQQDIRGSLKSTCLHTTERINS